MEPPCRQAKFAAPRRGRSKPSYSEYNARATLWEAVGPLDAKHRAPALILELAGNPRTVTLHLDTSKLSDDNRVVQVTPTLDDTYLDDAADSASQDIISLSRLRCTYQDIRKFRVNSKLGPFRAKRHRSAKPPAVFSSAQLIEGATCSETNRKLALTAARPQLGVVGYAILTHSCGGKEKSLTLAADTAESPVPSGAVPDPAEGPVSPDATLGTPSVSSGPAKQTLISNKPSCHTKKRREI